MSSASRVCFSQDQRFLAVSSQMHLAVFEIAPRRKPDPMRVAVHKVEITALFWGSDEHPFLLSGDSAGKVFVTRMFPGL